MSILAICPFCHKTITIERVPRVNCPECGKQIGFSELQGKKLFVDKRVEAKELESAKSCFRNAEFLNASEHFKKALEANKNSYAAQYFVSLCDIYLNEADKDFDVIKSVVDMIRSVLVTISYNSTPVADKLLFITAMLNETKIIITKRLNDRDEIYESNIDEYRKASIKDLTTLLDLFKIDAELIMSYSPDVKAALMYVIDCAVKISYKAVQSVIIGEDIHAPSDDDYKKLLKLSNDYCFFAHELDPSFEPKNYSPDFTRNNMFIDKVFSRFDKFDENNKHNKKKHIIGDIEEYNSILAECEKALRFTYLNCYRAMCSRQTDQHAHLFIDGLKLVFRLLTPRIVISEKKRVEIFMGSFEQIVEWCDMMTRFLVDCYELSDYVTQMLHDFYAELLDIAEMYFAHEFDKTVKMLNWLKGTPNEGNNLSQKFLYDAACCCAPALKKFVDFSAGTDKTREKLVKICQTATEDFLLFGGLSIEAIEHSEVYRPIMQISDALLEEEGEDE